MQLLCPIILFALSCGIVNGQRLTKPPASLSWMSKYEPVHPSSASHEYEAAQKRATLQAALGRKEIITAINLNRLNGNDLAAIYRACTGRRVIVSAAAASAEYSLVQNASPQHPITNAQLIELIKRSAVAEGFSFSPDGADPNLDVFTPVTRTRIICTSVPVFNESTPLPESDDVISYVMTLKYLEPTEAIRIFAPHADGSNPYSSLAPVPGARAIVATCRTSVIRKLVALKNEMDKP